MVRAAGAKRHEPHGPMGLRTVQLCRRPAWFSCAPLGNVECGPDSGRSTASPVRAPFGPLRAVLLLRPFQQSEPILYGQLEPIHLVLSEQAAVGYGASESVE